MFKKPPFQDTTQNKKNPNPINSFGIPKKKSINNPV
jgi:hypothetical protein